MRKHPHASNPNGSAQRGGPRHPRVLNPESPRRPEIQEEIRQGVRVQSGKVRGQTPPFGSIPS